MEDESLILDPQMDYNQVTGLSSEVREKLFKVKPTTIVSFALLASSSRVIVTDIECVALQGAAKRMEGMTPTSIVYLLRHAKRTFRRIGMVDPVLNGT